MHKTIILRRNGTAIPVLFLGTLSLSYSLDRKLNTLLLQLKKRGSISADLYNQLQSSGGFIPHLYGLPKIHKDGVPLRPIVSFVLSPSYQLSKFLARMLSPLVGNSDSHVNSSSEFVSFIRCQTLRPTDVLVSFDVVSLFTKVPINLARDVAQRRLQDDSTLQSRTNLSVQELIQLLEFCLSATYLSFRGRIFKQSFGTAMGSPVSVVVANLVMEDVEERALGSFDVQPLFWKRYVDDVCTAVPSHMVQHLLQHLNSIEQSIQFTAELESESLLPFLDVHLRHNPDGSVSTSVYRKSTHTDQYLHYTSHHPLSCKTAVIRTLCTRAGSHSSSRSASCMELDRVSSALKLNGYPRHLLSRHTSPSVPPVSSNNQPEWKSTVVLPYIQGLSESVRRILVPLDVRVCFRPLQTIKQIVSRPKDPIPDLQKSGVVYRVCCASCSASYIGQTGRRLCQRVDEHRRAVKMADFNSSALAEHAWSTGHQVDWNAVVLSNPRDATTRSIQEAISIRTTNNTLNRDSGALPSEYDNLVHTYFSF